MDIIYTILIGLVVGIIAKILLPGKYPGGFIITTLIGIAGAMLAKFIGQAMNWYAAGESAGFITSRLSPSTSSTSTEGTCADFPSRSESTCSRSSS